MRNMRFYYWILLIVIILNLLVIFTSINEYVKGVMIKASDPTFLMITSLSASVLLIVFWILVIKTGKGY